MDPELNQLIFADPARLNLPPPPPPTARGANRYSYHENPAHRYEHDFSSLPRDHRFMSWKRDLRPPPARRADIEGHEAVSRGHRRSFHYDDRGVAQTPPQPPNQPYVPPVKREISPAAARRSYDPSYYEPCDR